LKNNFSYILLLIVVSIFIASIVSNFKGDDWEENSRKALYFLKGDSVPSTATEYTLSNGVPYVHYVAENGVPAITRFNSTIVANYAIKYAQQFLENSDSTYYKKFLNCVQFLKDSVTQQNNLTFYQFNWQQGWYPNISPPFISSMTNGRAIEVFLYAYQFTNNNYYLQFAKNLLHAFYITVQNNGFAYKLNDSAWWYEEIAKPNVTTPYILDGHIYAIQGIQKLWLTTKSDSALYLFEKGINALKLKLPSYNAGKGEIYYDAHQHKADKKYHKILTNQIYQLWQSTNDSTFLRYYQQWIKPSKVPYVIRMLKEKNISGLLLIAMLSALFFPILYLVTNKIVLKK